MHHEYFLSKYFLEDDATLTAPASEVREAFDRDIIRYGILICVYVYISNYICMYVYIYIYIHTYMYICTGCIVVYNNISCNIMCCIISYDITIYDMFVRLCHVISYCITFYYMRGL